MISFWAMVLFLIGDSACSFSELTAKEGSCVTVHLTLSKTMHSGYIVWLKDAVWNVTAKDFEGTIVHSLKPEKPNASEFENRVSVGSTGNLYKLTISNLRLEDSGNYSVRYYDEDDPSYKLSSSTMSLNVQENPCQVSVTGPKLVQTGAEVILHCSTVGRCQGSPEWRRSGSGLASSKGSDTKGAKTAQLRFKVDWSHDGVTFSCWPSPSNHACASRSITLAVGDAPKDVRVTANPRGEVNEKTNLDLSCEARSNPGVDAYTWFKLTGRGAREVGQGPVLTLRNLSEAHTGQYFCRTRNEIGEGNSSVIDVTVRYGPRKPVVIHNMTSRGQPVKGSAVALMCSSQSYPPIRSYKWHIQKDVNVETLLRPGQNLTIGSDEEGIYYCSAENEISNSSSDPIEIRFDRFDITSLLIGAGASAGAMMMICLIMQLILKKKRHSQRSGSRMKDSEGIILSDVAAQDEESIYANKTMLSEAGAVEKADEAAPHYATVDFSKLHGTGGEHGTGIVRGTSKQTSDYAVIRHKSREEREGGEEEGEEAKEKVEKEGQAELGTERKWAEVRGEKEEESRPNLGPQASVNPEPTEEATYGNICPSRPTKRARQGLQQPPRNPAAEEEQRQEENSAGGQENMYVDAMSPLMEGNGKGTEECEYAVVRKPK